MVKDTCTVVVGNIKGGVGKTTVTILLARYLALSGKKVMVIDADPQGTATAHAYQEIERDTYGVPLKGLHKMLESYLKGGRIDIASFIANTVSVDEGDDESFLLLPNSLVSGDYEQVLRDKGLFQTIFPAIVKSAVESFYPDYVLVDCPPYVNSYFLSALSAGDAIVTPVETTFQSLPGVFKVLEVVEQYRAWNVTKIERSDIVLVPNKVQRSIESREVLGILSRSEQTRDLLIQSRIPHTIGVNKVFVRKMKLRELLNNENSPAARVSEALVEIVVRLQNIKARR